MVIPGSASALALSVLCLPWISPVFFGWLSCPEQAQQTLGRGNETDTSEFPVAVKQVKRIAVIGAGTGGLAALKTFLHDIPKPEGQRWEIELFERRSGLGGQWSYRYSRPAFVQPTDVLLDSGCQTMARRGIHISLQRHCIRNYTRTRLSREVTTDPLILQKPFIVF